jgi:hypothetical protein
MSDDFDWKKIAVAAGKVVAGVGKVAAGATGGPAAAQGVADAETGIYGALDGFGVQVPGAAEAGPAAKEPPQVTSAAKEVSPKAGTATPGVSPPAPKVTPQLSAPSLVATPPGTTGLDMQTLAPERTPGSPPMRTEVTPNVAVQPQKVSQEMSPAVTPDAPSRREPSRLDSFERGGRQAALAPTPSQSAGAFHRVDQFDREATRSRPLPAAPPAPTPQEQESQALIAVLVAAGWTNDEAQVIERGRSTESLRLIGLLSAGTRLPMVSGESLPMHTAQQVTRLGTLSDGRVTRLGATKPWLQAFADYRAMSTSERKVFAVQVLAHIDPVRLQATVLPVHIELPPSENDPQRLLIQFEALSEDEKWLLRKAIDESEQVFTLQSAVGG